VHGPAATMWAKKGRDIYALLGGKRYFASKVWSTQIHELEELGDGMGDKETREVARRNELPILI
jgi:hypothetical protein